jgi:hypothetical protein
MRTDLEYKQCEDYYKEIIAERERRIEQLERELKRVREALR